MPSAISLFSGCGGSDLGAIRSGFDVIMANDIFSYARDVYEYNHPATEYILSDIQKISSFPKADLLIGCYPCQGFSQGGVRCPNRKINVLYREFARALSLIKPKAFVVENVSGMLRSNFRHLLKDQITTFSDIGYSVFVNILNAAEFGVPQERKRIFIVGIKSEYNIEYSFPLPTHGEGRIAFHTIKKALRGMPEWPEGEFYDKGFHWYYLSRNRRVEWNSPSKTIVANPRHMPLHPLSPPLEKVENNVWKFSYPGRARRFSFREAAKLQGFQNLKFPETETASLNAKYTVVGNAVPPQLFEAVIRSLPEIW